MQLTNSEIALKKAYRQQYLFKTLPRRVELAKLKSEWFCKEISIRVHRNHSFEYVASVLNPFLTFAGYHAEFIYSDYDDSLSFSDCKENSVSMEIIWLDFDRYFANESNDISFFVSWLGSRIDALRKISKAPILINDWLCVVGLDQTVKDYNHRLMELLKDKPGVRIFSQQHILGQLGDQFFDYRSAKLTGSTWSDKACILNARQLAFQWIPASLSPRLKAVVLDLDHTLYEGVLGEDGIEKIILSDVHLRLQRELLRLKESGIFLAIASRNEQTDVEELFRYRTDLLLKLEDFSAIQVNWRDKAENITRISDSLRIGVDSILFIDDNPGEIARVSEGLPSIWTLLASHQIPTIDILKFYPRLWSWEKTNVDNLRLADLKAASARDLLATESQSIEEYWRVLQVELDIYFNPTEQLIRLCELSSKTNQFNLTLARINEVKMSEYLSNENCIVASIHLRDRLSDSGIISLIVGERVGESLIVREICISCRALGRHLESTMISHTIHQMIDLLTTKTIVFQYQKAPRNSPALNWLEQFTKVRIDDSEYMEIRLNNQDFPPIICTHLSALKIKTHHHLQQK